jgi:hypothetical protein
MLRRPSPAEIASAIRYCRVLAESYERKAAAAAAAAERRRYLRLAAAERRAMASLGQRLIAEKLQPRPAASPVVPLTEVLTYA